jgi:hypothetical protein
MFDQFMKYGHKDPMMSVGWQQGINSYCRRERGKGKIRDYRTTVINDDQPLYAAGGYNDTIYFTCNLP